MRRCGVLVVAALLAACGGGGGSGSATSVGSGSGAGSGAVNPACEGFCANAGTALGVAQVEGVIARAVAEAQARNARATIAVVDRSNPSSRASVIWSMPGMQPRMISTPNWVEVTSRGASVSANTESAIWWARRIMKPGRP